MVCSTEAEHLAKKCPQQWFCSQILLGCVAPSLLLLWSGLLYGYVWAVPVKWCFWDQPPQGIALQKVPWHITAEPGCCLHLGMVRATRHFQLTRDRCICRSSTDPFLTTDMEMSGNCAESPCEVSKLSCSLHATKNSSRHLCQESQSRWSWLLFQSFPMVIYPFHSLWSVQSDRFVLLLWEGMVLRQHRKNFKKGKAPLIWCSNDRTTNVRLPRLFGCWPSISRVRKTTVRQYSIDKIQPPLFQADSHKRSHSSLGCH